MDIIRGDEMEASGKRYIIHKSRKDKFLIWNLSDLHWWNGACDKKSIRRDINIIKNDPFSFWIGGGDYADYIGYTDKRFDPDCVPDNAKIKDLGRLGDVQVREVAKLFEPIKHKCLGLLLGNHELQYQRAKQQANLHAWLCTELGVPNLEYSALLDVVFCRMKSRGDPKIVTVHPGDSCHSSTFRFFVHHGAGFATTPGGKLNKLIQFMQMFEADIFMIGHVHDKTGRREPAIGANEPCDKLVEKQKIGVISGSYLKTYAQGETTYGEQRGYRPTTLGAATVSIVPETREMHGEI